MTNYRSLDLNDPTVICELVALDTDMTQFHYLCLEQGPFFKMIFNEFVTDAHRKGLQQKQPGMPGCPPHVSHLNRDYWKESIEKSQILVIHNLFQKFQVKWHELFSKFNAQFYFPRAEPSVPSPWTRLNIQFMQLATNICAICTKLTDAKDLLLAEPPPEPHFKVTEKPPERKPFRRRREQLDPLLDALAQLSESD